jgi:hypothetical protein
MMLNESLPPPAVAQLCRVEIKLMIKPSQLEPIAVAVPSFSAEWKRLLGEVGQDPASIGVEFQFLMCEHLTAQAATGDFRGFSCLFDALEEALKEPSTELYDELTSGLLNTLLHTCERKGIDLGLVADCITGPTVRKEWNASYRWTHRDEEPSWL